MPAKFPRFRGGEQFGIRGRNGELILDAKAANFLNATVAEMQRLGKVSAIPPMRWSEGADGRRVSCDVVPEIWAKLSGTGPQYSFVQQQYNPGTNTWSDMDGGRTGDECYESKGKTGLSGKVVRITYVPSAGDWRFQYVGLGTQACESGRICVTVTSGCSFPLEGLIVTVTDNATPPNVIGTGAASGTPAKYCVDIPAAGTYTVTTKIAGGVDRTATVNAVCGIDNNVTITYPTGAVGRIAISFTYCNGTPGATMQNYAGVEVHTLAGGVGGGSATSGSDGIAYLVVAPGTHKLIATYPRGLVKDYTVWPDLNNVVVTSCGTKSIEMGWVMRTLWVWAGSSWNSTYGYAECSGTLNVYSRDGTLCGTATLTLAPTANPPPIQNSYDETYMEYFPEYDGLGSWEVIWPTPESSFSAPAPASTGSCGIGFGMHTGDSPRPCSEPL